MRRRVHASAAQWPRELVRFRAQEWRAGCHPECSWWAARVAWQESHPDADLPAPTNTPDTPFHPEKL